MDLRIIIQSISSASAYLMVTGCYSISILDRRRELVASLSLSMDSLSRYVLKPSSALTASCTDPLAILTLNK